MKSMELFSNSTEGTKGKIRRGAGETLSRPVKVAVLIPVYDEAPLGHLPLNGTQHAVSESQIFFEAGSILDIAKKYRANEII